MTDRIRLVLDEDGNGTIRFGEEALFDAPTDPDALYPPTHPRPDWEVVDAFLAGVRSGFEFTVEEASVVDSRLQLSFHDSQVMQPWCALQDDSSLPGWECKSGGFSISGEEEGCHYTDEDGELTRSISCDRALQCMACDCSGESCVVAEHYGDQIFLDASLTEDGTELRGTLLLPDELGGRVTVVMSL